MPVWDCDGWSGQILRSKVLLAGDGFIPVPKKLTISSLPAIKEYRIPGQGLSHDMDYSRRTAIAPKKKVDVIGQHRPAITDDHGLRNGHREPLSEIVPIVPRERRFFFG